MKTSVRVKRKPLKEVSNWSLSLILGNSAKGSFPFWDELLKIGECESGHEDYICNKEYGCSAGTGRWMIIPSTAEYCSEKIGREINPFIPEDNFDCTVWLLENEGNIHWSQSRHCWDK